MTQCDLITGEPDKELNPKKKVWEQIQPDLHTDGQCIATYKELLLRLPARVFVKPKP